MTDVADKERVAWAMMRAFEALAAEQYEKHAPSLLTDDKKAVLEQLVAISPDDAPLRESKLGEPIAGLLTADGTLDISLLNNFAPQLGDTFDLLGFGSLNGSFSVINTPTLSGGLAFDTSSLLTTGSISVVPEPTTAAFLSLFTLTFIHRRTR